MENDPKQCDPEQIKVVNDLFANLHENRQAFRTFGQLCAAIHLNARVHGWYDEYEYLKEKLPLEMAASLFMSRCSLMACREFGEQAEELREAKWDYNKILEEGADAVIRAMDYLHMWTTIAKEAGELEETINAGDIIGRKIMTNIVRPRLHGKRF